MSAFGADAIDNSAGSHSPFWTAAGKVDDVLRKTTGFVAATILGIEVIILFAGVVARYVFHRPLIWTDEINSILFLWLGTLGSALALRSWQHMRMDTFVLMLGPEARKWTAGFSNSVVLLFTLALLPTTIEHMETEIGVISPTLEISLGWRAAAMPAGLLLMLYAAFMRYRDMQAKVVFGSLAALAAAGLILYLVSPVFAGLGQINLIIFFLVGVPLMVFSGVPIAFAFCVSTFAYLTLTTYIPPSILVARLEAGMAQLLLLAIPTFVFLGLLIEMTGMAERMVRFLANLLGHVRGGLHYVLVVAMYLVSGISGSKAADMAAIAPALFPGMEKLGHNRDQMTALLAATGAQTETVPPSLILIAVGSVTGLSIAALFTAGLLPAAFLGALLCLVVWHQSRKSDIGIAERQPGRVIWNSFLMALPALLLPFVIRAAVVEGAATATEVSTVGVAYSVVVGIVLLRRFDWSRLYPMLTATASLSGAILLVTGAATAMAWALTQSGFSQNLAAAVSNVPGGIASFMALSFLMFVVLGSVLEGLPAIVLFGPLMFPVARALGVDEIYYAIVTILAMSLGLFAPPFGVGFYITCAIGGADPNRSMRYLWPYLAVLTIGVIIITCIPWMSTGFIR